MVDKRGPGVVVRCIQCKQDYEKPYSRVRIVGMSICNACRKTYQSMDKPALTDEEWDLLYG